VVSRWLLHHKWTKAVVLSESLNLLPDLRLTSLDICPVHVSGDFIASHIAVVSFVGNLGFWGSAVVALREVREALR
jgi:hypothetical protein